MDDIPLTITKSVNDSPKNTLPFKGFIRKFPESWHYESNAAATYIKLFPSDKVQLKDSGHYIIMNESKVNRFSAKSEHKFGQFINVIVRGKFLVF